MMQTLNVPHNAPSREATILKIDSRVDPLDSYQASASTLINPTAINVARLGQSVIDLDWYVDGLLRVNNDVDDILQLAGLGLAPGLHTVTALAADEIVALANTGLDFDWVRKDLSQFQQSVTWNVSIAPEPATLAIVAFALLPAVTRRRRMAVG